MIPRHLILGLSGFAVGSAAWLTVNRLRIAFRKDRWQTFYALASGGFAGGVLLIAKAVYRSPHLALTGDVIWYSVSLTAASVGYIGILLDQRRRGRREGDGG